MNIADIKLGETYQYYFYDSDKRLRHFPVIPIKKNKKTVVVVTRGAPGNPENEMRINPDSLDNRQLEAF